MDKTDLRVIKTERNIKSVFIQLLLEKDLETITVQELLDRAMINRSTFYKHYSDKYVLLEAIASEFMTEFRKMAEERAATVDPANLLIGVDRIYARLAPYRDVILALWKINTENVHIEDDIQEILEHFFLKTFHGCPDLPDSTQYQARLFSAMVLVNLRFSMEHLEVDSSEKLVTELASLYNLLKIREN